LLAEKPPRSLHAVTLKTGAGRASARPAYQAWFVPRVGFAQTPFPVQT
jgi:hypothetical protein